MFMDVLRGHGYATRASKSCYITVIFHLSTTMSNIIACTCLFARTVQIINVKNGESAREKITEYMQAEVSS